MTAPLRPADWFPLPLHPPAEHHQALARYRAGPVERVAVFPAGPPVWLLTRYDDVAAVLHDETGFSLDVVDERYRAVLGGSIVTLAPTARRALRRVLLERLRPDDDLAATVREVVEQRIAALASGPREVDLVPTLAAEVPARVLTRLLGLPEQRWPVVAGLAAAAARLLDDPRGAVRAARDLRRLLTGVVAEPPAAGEAGLVAALTEVEVDGRRLTATEIVSSLLLLCWAGTETAFPALATCLYAVLTTPGEAARVRASADRAGAAVDEALRWEAPVQVSSRRAVRPASVRGVDLAPGDVVLLHLGSANRDEQRFPDPDRFDPDRFDPDRLAPGRAGCPSLAFGSGVHRCLGASLARTEVATATREVLRHFPDLRLDPASPPVAGAVVRSPRRLCVRLH